MSEPSIKDLFTARIQEVLNAEVGAPESCERPNGHVGPCGWFISRREREDAILEGRCGAEEVKYSGVIRA